MPDDSGWTASFDGPFVPVVVAIAAHNCGVVYFADNTGLALDNALQNAGIGDCAALAPPPIDANSVDPRRISVGDLVGIAFDRARSLVTTPQLALAPATRGLTGLASFFWLTEEPNSVAATAEVPGFTVTAEARPVQYVWTFGDGSSTTTSHHGRPWTKRQRGNIRHMYETKGRYDLTVEVVYEARWRSGTGTWQPLGYFSTSATQPYRVQEMTAVLTRSRR